MAEKIRKYDIRVGDYIYMEWRGRKYYGQVVKINPQEWARKTNGKFIAIDLKTPSGKIVGMPYTNRAVYERYSYEEFKKIFMRDFSKTIFDFSA